ncbi:MAG: O-antigen ligase family protein [Brooklawnia sp.]|jgi:O-antigen ligase
MIRRANVRRWALLVLIGLLGLGLTAAASWAALKLPPYRYQATSQALLLLPTESRTLRTPVNPYLYRPSGLIRLANVPLPLIRSADFHQEMQAAGFESQFESDVEITDPIVRFSVEGPDPDDVDATMHELRQQYDQMIAAAQTEEGVPDRQVARVLPIQSVPATALTGDRNRAALMAGVVGFLLTVLGLSIVNRRLPPATGTTAASPAQPAQSPVPTTSRQGRPKRRRNRATASGGMQLPAVAFLIGYVVLLLLIPSRLIVGAIGSPGKPASLWSLLGLGLWLLMTIAGLNQGRSRPIRIAAGMVALTTATAYISGNMLGWYQSADIHQRSDSRWRLATQPELQEVMISAGDRGLLAMAGWLGLVLLTAEGMRSWRDLELLTTWLVRLAGVVAALGLLQYFTGTNVAAMIRVPGLSTGSDFVTFTRADLNRVVVTSGHPIEYGVIMATLLPLALHRSFYNRKIGSWIPTGLIGIAVLLSVSRSAILVAGGAFIVLFLGWSWRRRITALVCAPVLAVAGRAVFPGLLGTVRALFVNVDVDPSVAGRIDDYPFVIRFFSENPLFGRGLFTWATYYYRTLDNEVFMILLELGALGLAAFIGLVLTGVVSGVGCHWLTPDPRKQHLGLCLAASITGISLSYITFDTLGFAQAAGLTFLLVGMAGAAWRLSQQDRHTILTSQPRLWRR